jgi:hypothetical protein
MTQKIMLTNKEKFRVRSAKDYRWGYVEKMQ